MIDEPDPPPIVVTLDPSARPDHGVRDYARIRESMADITGVNPLLPDDRHHLPELEQQLPSAYDVRSFVSSNQVGISKLALEFCDALVESTPLRTTFFGSFPFDSEPYGVGAATPDTGTATRSPTRSTTRCSAPASPSSRSRADTRARSVDDGRHADDGMRGYALQRRERTRTIVKGECTAVLASAAMSMH